MMRNRRDKYKPRKAKSYCIFGAEKTGVDTRDIYAAPLGASVAAYVGTLERRNWRWYPGGYTTLRSAMFALMEAND